MSDVAHEHIPELTLEWRLKMSLGKMTGQEMADALEISRTTISRWMSGRGKPPSVYVKQWALITGTNMQWLLTGQQNTPQPGEPDEGRSAAVRRECVAVLQEGGPPHCRSVACTFGAP